MGICGSNQNSDDNGNNNNGNKNSKLLNEQSHTKGTKKEDLKKKKQHHMELTPENSISKSKKSNHPPMPNNNENQNLLSTSNKVTIHAKVHHKTKQSDKSNLGHQLITYSDSENDNNKFVHNAHSFDNNFQSILMHLRSQYNYEISGNNDNNKINNKNKCRVPTFSEFGESKISCSNYPVMHNQMEQKNDDLMKKLPLGIDLELSTRDGGYKLMVIKNSKFKVPETKKIYDINICEFVQQPLRFMWEPDEENWEKEGGYPKDESLTHAIRNQLFKTWQSKPNDETKREFCRSFVDIDKVWINYELDLASGAALVEDIHRGWGFQNGNLREYEGNEILSIMRAILKDTNAKTVSLNDASKVNCWDKNYNMYKDDRAFHLVFILAMKSLDEGFKQGPSREQPKRISWYQDLGINLNEIDYKTLEQDIEILKQAKWPKDDKKRSVLQYLKDEYNWKADTKTADCEKFRTALQKALLIDDHKVITALQHLMGSGISVGMNKVKVENSHPLFNHYPSYEHDNFEHDYHFVFDGGYRNNYDFIWYSLLGVEGIIILLNILLFILCCCVLGVVFGYFIAYFAKKVKSAFVNQPKLSSYKSDIEKEEIV